MTELQFLFLEDNPLDFDVVRVILAEGGIDCQLTWVETRADFVTALETDRFDLILADYALPSFDGLIALEIARTTCPDVPFIFVSGSMGEELAIESLKQGATDYVLKQRLERLVSCVRRALKEARQHRECQEMAAALRHREAQFRSFAENSNDVIWITDAREYRLVYVSPSYERIWGRSRDEIYGDLTNFITFVHPEDRDRVRESWQKCAHKLSIQEYRILRPDGEIVWIRDRGFPIYDDSGNLLGLGGIAEDISDRRQAEVEREKLLKREQVARAEAERANRLKDEFLAIVSHELRTPLNPILGWAKLIQTKQLNPQQTTEALKIIERKAELQAKLIEDLLDISRILRGKLSLDVVAVNLVSIVNSALETVTLAAKNKSIQIYTVLEPNSGLVSGDANRLQQVLWNLLSNAIKFTPEGGRIDIRLENLGSTARISVSDTGKGIAPQFLPYVFNYFRQQEDVTTRKFGGLGLGLAIVHHLVELHGGTIEAESPGEGQGATFTVTLPLTTDLPQPSSNRPQELALNLKGMKILVVDDDSETLKLLAFLLEGYGANAIAAASAVEAFDSLIRYQPDILLSDIAMPEIDGYTLMRRVRTLPPERGGQIPAIALTAFAAEIDSRQAMSAGFQKHISKPVVPAKLVEAIIKLVV
jgi:PAS domain S-box-containing protein